ncbi:MAG: DUF349 domain-containing protein, partial [Oceanobacter sp.]
MALFAKFLKPKWQHQDPDVRRKAIAELSAEQDLLACIEAEAIAELRAIAVKRLTNHQILEDLLAHSHKDVQDVARQHALSLLLPDSSQLDAIADTSVLIKIAGLTQDQTLRLAAIQRIQDEDERLNIARTHAVAKVRLAAAEGIRRQELLQQLLEHAQGKDKAVYRYCKDRLAEHKAEYEAKAAQQAKIEQLKENLAHLLRHGYGPEFTGRLQVFDRQAAQLDSHLNAEERDYIQGSLTQAKQILQQHAEEEAQRAEAEQAAKQAKEHQTTLLDQLERMLASSHAVFEDPSGWQQQRAVLDQSWQETQSALKASADQIRQFENQMQQVLMIQNAAEAYNAQREKLDADLAAELPADLKDLQRQLRRMNDWQAQFSWPESLPTPNWIHAIEARKDAINDKLDGLKSREQESLGKIKKQIEVLEAHLQGGHLKDANKSFSQLMNSLRMVDSRAAQDYQRQARALGAQLNEMRDWQGYVTQPKKEALCEAMEALVEADIAPDILADQIQALQEEWKTLQNTGPDKALWERFQAAGDKAFEPCRAYFAEVAQQREANVARRRQLTEELTAYEAAMDWDTADWQVVQKTLDAAREAFRSFSPVDRASHRETQDAFRAVCDKIYAHVQAEFDNNLAAKKQLVEQAAALLDLEDIGEAINGVKTLQQQWKTVGVTPRSADQKLWKQFREHCDAVFSQLDKQKAERKAAIDEVVTQAEQLLEQARQLVELDEPVSESRNQLQALEQACAEIELPKSAEIRMRKGFAAVADALIEKHQYQQQEAERARWQGLLDQLLAIANRDEEVKARIEDTPAAYRPAVEKAWQLIEGTEQADTRDEALIRDLCIQMEILTQQETPAQDQARRMELQVQRLAQ